MLGTIVVEYCYIVRSISCAVSGYYYCVLLMDVSFSLENTVMLGIAQRNAMSR